MSRKLVLGLIFVVLVPLFHLGIAVIAIFELECGRTTDVSPVWGILNRVTAFPAFYTDMAQGPNPSIVLPLLLNAAVFSAICFVLWLVATRTIRRSHPSPTA